MIDSERSRVPVIGIIILLLLVFCVLEFLAIHKRNRRQPTVGFTGKEDNTMISIASPAHLSIEDLPVSVQDSQPLPEVRRIQSCSDDHLDETTCPEGMDEHTEEEEELHLPVAESGTLLDQEKSSTGS